MLVAIWALCQVAHAVASIWMLLAILSGSDRAWRLAVSYDQLANTAFGGNEDETISSRANRARSERRSWGCILCRLLDRIEKDHCKNSEGI
jgi:DNA polymerase III delta prime subunit